MSYQICDASLTIFFQINISSHGLNLGILDSLRWHRSTKILDPTQCGIAKCIPFPALVLQPADGRILQQSNPCQIRLQGLVEASNLSHNYLLNSALLFQRHQPTLTDFPPRYPHTVHFHTHSLLLSVRYCFFLNTIHLTLTQTVWVPSFCIFRSGINQTQTQLNPDYSL